MTKLNSPERSRISTTNFLSAKTPTRLRIVRLLTFAPSSSSNLLSLAMAVTMPRNGKGNDSQHTTEDYKEYIRQLYLVQKKTQKQILADLAVTKKVHLP